MKSTLGKGLLAGALLTCVSTVAMAQDFELQIQSSDPAGDPNYQLWQGWAEEVGERTDGRVKINMMSVGSVVDFQETLDAVGAGILDGHVTDTSYFAGKDPAFGLIGNPTGAWSDPREMLKFFNEGGGKELMNELVEPYGTYFVGATTPGLEAFVSDVPLDGVDDLDGLKVRAPAGLVQRVFGAAGASPVNLPTSEVFTALDKGVVDAADYSVFHVNQDQGLHEIARHPVYPGFHSMPLIELSINRGVWESMPEDIQQIFEESVADLAQRQMEAVDAKDAAAIEEAEAQGATVHDWPAEERARFRSIAMGEWEEIATESENAQKVYDTLTKFLREEGLLSDE
ncbi:TRAP transporter substrate-binding protein DctP [Aquibaculum arenosum]|uniref:TRAP transporter substrate-binding protein DctP n=1 Tax=Aquibaculum arenosum TaxID=3032591 RepID=A0ABT5YPY6_9PROT|nr:TRAP transporter substrate-binding protein DctP [Fodinicurvata sp. CAU 1616]MDF2097013.1 TRAP transporter substrate-binding protein DctP [Fodinicurvata sp. CAU 1616]